MTVSPAFWPGLALAALLIALWVNQYAWHAYRRWCWREECALKGTCPDCEMVLSHCTCFWDADE